MITMNDDYAELTIASKEKHVSVLVIILTVLAAIAGALLVITINALLPESVSMLGSILIAVYICVCIPAFATICHPKNVDYDYLYVENDLEISRVINKSKRKTAILLHLQHAKRIAPKGSQSILGYEGKGNVKIKDFTSVETTDPYVIVMEKDQDVIEILIEPEEHLLTLIKARNKDIFYES